MEYWHDTYGGLTMVVITKLIIAGIAIVCAVTLTFIVLEFVEDKVISKFSKKRNRVKFYVARDKSGLLNLYIGKPERAYSVFVIFCGDCVCPLENEYDFKKFGLKADDFKNLKWEDEPLEVFLNMEE